MFYKYIYIFINYIYYIYSGVQHTASTSLVCLGVYFGYEVNRTPGSQEAYSSTLNNRVDGEAISDIERLKEGFARGRLGEATVAEGRGSLRQRIGIDCSEGQWRR